MTDSDADPNADSDADSGAPARVCCCVRAGRDRDLLVEWLTENGYDPVVVAPEELSSASFDCCIVDESTLREAESSLRRRRTADPGLLPCLLLTPEDAASTLADLPRSIAGVVTDVLETPLRTVVLRRRLENALSARRLSTALAGSRERYRRLVEQTPAAVFLLEAGELTYVNAAAERLLGRAETEIVGNDLESLLTAPDRDRIAELIDALDPGEATEFVEATFAGADRSVPVELAATRIGEGDDGTLPVEGALPDDGSHPDGGTLSREDAALTGNVQITAHDVSRRRTREDQLRLYRRAIDAATVGITISNPSLPDNPLIYVNEEFERLTGRSREDLLGRNARILQSPNTDPETVSRVRRAIDAGEAVSVELVNRRADGTEWYNSLDVTPIHGPDGEVEYFLGFQRDVTERRERELRLAVLDRVLRHNIRNRLNVVLGHVEELEELAMHGEGSELDDTADTVEWGDRAESTTTHDDDVAFHASRIRSSAEGLLSLSSAARRFRSVLRTDDGEDSARLDRVLRGAMASFRDERPELDLQVDLDPVWVRSAVGLDVAVEELAANAAVHAGEDATVQVTLRREGDDAVVAVADDGPGIPESERGGLSGLEESPVEHASGLGLWLVRWVVDDLGGEVAYADGDPTGAVVTLRVPVAADEE